MRTGCGPRRTLHREFVGFGGPIVIEEILKIDVLVTLSLLRPQQVTALDLDLQAHLGCRSNISAYAQNLASLRSEDQGAYRRWAGAQVRLSSLCNSLSSSPTNSLGVYFSFGMSCNVIPVCCPS
jgi:hypothetical protein